MAPARSSSLESRLRTKQNVAKALFSLYIVAFGIYGDAFGCAAVYLPAANSELNLSIYKYMLTTFSFVTCLHQYTCCGCAKVTDRAQIIFCWLADLE